MRQPSGMSPPHHALEKTGIQIGRNNNIYRMHTAEITVLSNVDDTMLTTLLTGGFRFIGGKFNIDIQ